MVKRFGNSVYSNEHNGTYLFLEGDDINPSKTYDSLTEVEEATRDKKLSSLWLKHNVSNGKLSDAILYHDQVGYKAGDEANINGRHYYQELVLDPEMPVKTINDFVVEVGDLYIDNDVLRRTAVIEHFKAYLKEQNFCSKFYLGDGVTGVVSDFQPTYKIDTYGISFDKEGESFKPGVLWSESYHGHERDILALILVVLKGTTFFIVIILCSPFIGVNKDDFHDCFIKLRFFKSRLLFLPFLIFLFKGFWQLF